jgi:hypothetical protein
MRAGNRSAAAKQKNSGWTTNDIWAAVGIGLGVVALVAAVALVALPALAVAGGVIAAVAITGAVAGVAGTIIDGIDCAKNHNNLACAGAIFDTATTCFATGGLALPEEMLVGYGVVTAPYAVTGGVIDTVNGVNGLRDR